MNYANIKNYDVANGEGIRVSLFVSGCTHHCPECFNREAWDFEYGEPYTPLTEDRVIVLAKNPRIDGLSLLGGEPFEPCNQRELVKLLRRFKKECPNKDVWCYTGYLYDAELKGGSRARCEVTDEMLSMIDFLVDGRFMVEKKNLRLRFRGSTNQRIIDLRATEKAGEICFWEGLKDERL